VLGRWAANGRGAAEFGDRALRLSLETDRNRRTLRLKIVGRLRPGIVSSVIAGRCLSITSLDFKWELQP
jgi:hypothetical protein